MYSGACWVRANVSASFFGGVQILVLDKSDKSCTHKVRNGCLHLKLLLCVQCFKEKISSHVLLNVFGIV